MNKGNSKFKIVSLIIFASFLIFVTIVEFQNVNAIAFFPPPLKQIKDGVTPTSVTCSEGLELVLKQSNGQPACLKPTSVTKLLERGWAIHILPDYTPEKNNLEIFAPGNYDVESMQVSYFEDIQGFLAKPKTSGNFPGVVMIHEWWGLNNNIKEMAEKLASHGYIVLAVDLYNNHVGTTAEEARQLMTSFDSNEGIKNMRAAVSYLQTNYSTEKIGSIGWCFGGGQSLNLAVNSNLDATVMYYGQPITDEEQLSHITWPLLGIFAEEDQGIPPDTVKNFESKLNEVGITNDIFIYPGLNHAFANPSGDRYAPEAAKDAWAKTVTFFDDNLK